MPQLGKEIPLRLYRKEKMRSDLLEALLNTERSTHSAEALSVIQLNALDKRRREYKRGWGSPQLGIRPSRTRFAR